MEEFFQVSWFCDDENETNNNFVVNQSAFVSFGSKSNEGFGVSSYGNVSMNHRNMNKRMIEFLKKNWSPKNGQVKIEKEKVHKHMIKERIRREKQKQSYLNLYKLLPMGTKVSSFPLPLLKKKVKMNLSKMFYFSFENFTFLLGFLCFLESNF